MSAVFMSGLKLVRNSSAVSQESTRPWAVEDYRDLMVGWQRLQRTAEKLGIAMKFEQYLKLADELKDEMATAQTPATETAARLILLRRESEELQDMIRLQLHSHELGPFLRQWLFEVRRVVDEMGLEVHTPYLEAQASA